jgi:HPt (histidine-containing phosphotransfer) domain-containing protein
MADAPAPIRSLYAEDSEFRDLLGMFVDELPERVAKIRATLADGDRQMLLVLTHQLKGAGGGYGFAPITQASRALEAVMEQGAQAGDDEATALRQAVDDLAAICQRVIAE